VNYLFGGCMIKEAGSESLDNLAGAVVSAWPESIGRLASRYGAAQVVVTSHGPVGDKGLLDHTLRLLEARASAKNGGWRKMRQPSGRS
jgi:metallo-beta-lactamase class B